MSKTKKILIIAAVLVLGVIVGVNSYKSSSNTIEIGALFPMTGGLASYGEPAQKVAQLAVDEINAKGGINGKKLEINFQDHKCDAKSAVSAYQNLHNTGTNLFLAVGCSGTVLSVAPQLKDSVLLLSAATSPKISKV